jgi:hypothetical protein
MLCRSMYLPFFDLNEKPFTYLTPNPRFLYYAPQYLSIKRKTEYVVSERSYSATLENLTAWLVEQYRSHRFPVLIIDEAQNVVRDGLSLLAHRYRGNMDSSCDRTAASVTVATLHPPAKVV